MDKNTLKIIYGVMALIALIGFFKFVERYQIVGDGNVPASEDNVASSSDEGQTSIEAGTIEYRNADYGFVIDLPSSWQGYSIINGEWKGYHYIEGKGDTVIARGLLLKVRHPEWTEQNPRQDIPIMVFTPEQWENPSSPKDAGKSFVLGAAGVGPMGLGKNSKYVFALPARYNATYLPGWEEVDQIIRNSFKVLD